MRWLSPPSMAWRSVEQAAADVSRIGMLPQGLDGEPGGRADSCRPSGRDHGRLLLVEFASLGEDPAGVDPDRRSAVARPPPPALRRPEHPAARGPEGVDRRPPHRRSSILSSRAPRRLARARELVGGVDADGEVRVRRSSTRSATCAFVQSWRRRRVPLPSWPRVDDPPDPAALAVAAGVGQRDLVVADDPVVEVGDVERAVGAELDVDRAEPGVVAREEVGLRDRLGRGAVPLEAVVVDPVGDDVADEERVAVRVGEVVGRVVGDAADAGRAVVVASSSRGRSRGRRGLAEARVVGRRGGAGRSAGVWQSHE